MAGEGSGLLQRPVWTIRSFYPAACVITTQSSLIHVARPCHAFRLLQDHHGGFVGVAKDA